jgi:hypothetical protein
MSKLSLALLLMGLICPLAASHAQPAVYPDRAPELMQLQFASRAAHAPMPAMDGPRASLIYKNYVERSARPPQGPAPAPGYGAAPQ